MSQRYLIDTHCWLWWNAVPERLNRKAMTVIASGDNEILFSVVSGWEISIKHAMGKLKLPGDPLRYVPDRLQSNRINTLPVHLHHALHAGQLPAHHRDPFDRMLVATAHIENLILITADRQLEAYDVDLLWAV